MNVTHSISNVVAHTHAKIHPHTHSYRGWEKKKKKREKLSGPEVTSSKICMAYKDQPKKIYTGPWDTLETQVAHMDQLIQKHY